MYFQGKYFKTQYRIIPQGISYGLFKRHFPQNTFTVALRNQSVRKEQLKMVNSSSKYRVDNKGGS